MKLHIIIFLLSLSGFTAMPDGNYYYCKGNKVELSLFHLFADKSFADLEFYGHKQELKKFHLQQKGGVIDISFEEELSGRNFTASLAKPALAALPEDSDVIDYGKHFITTLVIAGKQHYPMQCRILGFNKEFIDKVMGAIP